MENLRERPCPGVRNRSRQLPTFLEDAHAKDFSSRTLAAVFGASAIMIGQSQLEIEHLELWFVELSSPPTSEGTSPSALEREEIDFRSAASGAGIRYTEGRRFRSLWNGLTVRASAKEVPKLRSLPGVQAVYPVVLVHPAQEIEDPPGNVADLVTALQMTGADVAQQELGLTGRGVRVAVMDSGIDYDHPDLGGCFGPGCRVAKGFDFVGDAFNPNPAAVGFNPIPVPIRFPTTATGTARTSRASSARTAASRASRRRSRSTPTASSAARARRRPTSCSPRWK